jgi:hypothetical protein
MAIAHSATIIDMTTPRTRDRSPTTRAKVAPSLAGRNSVGPRRTASSIATLPRSTTRTNAPTVVRRRCMRLKKSTRSDAAGRPWTCLNFPSSRRVKV